MNKHREIEIEKIHPNQHQPRMYFDDESLFELAQSIRENGLIQPVVVREHNPNYYEIIAGERRYRAMMMIGYTVVPCIITDADEERSATLALIENIQRENLSAVEEAKAYREILRIQQLTQKELAKQVGKSQSAIANKIRLLDLPNDVLNALDEKKISERHARAMVGIEHQKAEAILDEVLNKKLNVRETEKLVNKPKRKQKPVTRGYSGNIKIGINTIKKSVEMIEKTGINVKQELKETDDEVIVLVRFPKE